MKIQQNSEKRIPILFAILTIAAYGLLLPFTGFYWDDWPFAWMARFQGPAEFFPAFYGVRPFLSPIFFVTTSLIPPVPLYWLPRAGISPLAKIAPLLPGAEGLPALLKDSADLVLVDRLNYHNADAVYKKYGMQLAMKDSFFRQKGEELRQAFEKEGIPCQVLY